MPLIDLTTDLKSLQYGADRPGGGSSGQPYIQSPDPSSPTLNSTTQATFLDYYLANKNTLDFPVRGGVLRADPLTGRVTTLAGLIDKSRIKAFLNDQSRGTIFLFKQQGLQLSNPTMQVPGSLAFAGLSVGNDIISSNRIYNPKGLNTLQQVGAQGTGTHIPRHGLLPRYVSSYQQTYEYFVSKNNEETTNRLTLLASQKLQKIDTMRIDSKTGTVNKNLQSLLSLIDHSNKYSISPLNTQILNYVGGPNSTYGIGFTIIKRATDTTQATGKAATQYNAFTMTYQQLMNQDTTEGRNKSNPVIQDFRIGIERPASSNGNFLTANYNADNKWYNLAIRGNPGAVETTKRVKYNDINKSKIDKVNAKGLFYYDSETKTPWEAGGENTKDIIKFAFECLDNDTPGQAIAIVFRAFLTGFTDQHQGEYNTFKYLGRGETFRTYQGFTRSIGFNFKIAAQSREEMKPLYTKLNHLISQVYPDYSTNSGLMRGSVIKLTIGDYLYRVPGFLESLNVTVADEYAWEIALDKEGIDDDMRQLPQIVEVQCSFKPIHDFLPRRENKLNTLVPLIAAGKYPWLSPDIEGIPSNQIIPVEVAKPEFIPGELRSRRRMEVSKAPLFNSKFESPTSFVD